MPNIKPVVISAPFGNYFNFAGATRTLGTFTWHHRGGLAYRLWRCLRTLRYSRKLGGWVNKLGLPSPGILSLDLSSDYSDKIISIHGFNKDEWCQLATICAHVYRPLAVELNLSCPNVGFEGAMSDLVGAASSAIKLCQRENVPVIAKIPPLRWGYMIKMLTAMGIEAFHCCNTIPCPGGGISGKVLGQYSIWCVEELRSELPRGDFTLIGGGGVYNRVDYYNYKLAGADHVALGSMLLNPFNWRSAKDIINNAGANSPEHTEASPGLGDDSGASIV